MISDFVKGRKQFDHSPGVQAGIRLHREIDHFTDTHEATRKAKEYFRPVYRLYSGALTDVVFDHFLAIEPSVFSETSLLEFSLDTYEKLEKHQSVFPHRFAFMFSYMKEQNWLFNYRTTGGIEKSLAGVIRRAAYLDDAAPAIELFHQYYQPLQEIFRQFWPELQAYALEKWQNSPTV
jgi:acyl carrier protein phosphodiesterase